MKVLLFSDLHRHLGQCQRPVHRTEQEAIDLVIGAGDFGNIRHGLDKTITVLKAITQPTVLTLAIANRM